MDDKSRKWPTGIRPRGDGIQIRLWRQGQEIYTETLPGDPYQTSDLAAAVRRREELVNRLKVGLPLFDGDEGSSAQLFSTVAQDYMDSLDVEYSTSITYEYIINRYWIPQFGDWLISDVRPRHIKSVLAQLDLSQKSKKNVLIPLRGIFSFAQDDEQIDSNPVASVRLKRHQKPKIQRFTPDEKSRILAQFKKMGDRQCHAYFSLFFATGLRPGELLGLQWTDWDGTRLHVHRQIVRRKIKNTTKTHEARYVYVPTWAIPAIQALPSYGRNSEPPWLFLNSQGTPWLDTDFFNNAWKLALERENISYRVPYTCRHTRAAELLSQNVEPGRAARELGHSLEMFFRTYSEWIDEYSRGEDLNKLEGMAPKST